MLLQVFAEYQSGVYICRLSLKIACFKQLFDFFQVSGTYTPILFFGSSNTFWHLNSIDNENY